MDADGRPLGGAAGQRRLLAVLAVLAVAGDAGLSRDRLIGLLWPESDEERARHSLTQALYSARRALDADDLFAIAGDVRLNRDRLATDVEEFERAIDDGDLERAAALYQGPFLEGFYLPGSTEFEQWSMLHRARLEDRAASVLDRLAEQAEGAGDLRTAVDWRRRLAGMRPLDSAAAAKLMTVLAQAGDRAGAMRHAQLHEMLLREQLGLDPDPALAALAERLREPGAWTPDFGGTGGESAPAAPAAEVTVEGSAPVATIEAAPDGAPRQVERSTALTAVDEEPRLSGPVAGTPTRARPARRRRLGWLLAAALALVAAVVVVQRARRPAPPPATPQLRQRVVVAPFRVAGASPELAYLRDGLVELLSARLADDSVARSVDAGAVLAAWRAAGLTESVPRDTVVRLAARLGAERVVVGSVVGTPSRTIVSAAVVAVPSGAVSGEATVDGPADSIMTLVDRLAARLLVVQAGEDVSLASQTTESLRALRAFLTGQAAFRTAGYGMALRQYERALQLDSTFALAALQLVRTADRLHTDEARGRGLALAWRYQEALSERDRAALVAVAGPRWPAPSGAEEQLAAWERLVDLTPDRAEAWYELGERLFHDGAVLGGLVPNARARAAAALGHALALDSAYAPARKFLVLLAAGAPPEPAAGALPPDGVIADSTGPLAPFVRWRAAVARGDSATVRRVRDSLTWVGRGSLRAIAQASLFDAVSVEDGRTAARMLRERPGRLAERLEALEAGHAVAVATGRPREALELTGRLEELQPGSHTHLRLRVLDALYGDGVDAAAAAAELRRLAAAPPVPRADVRAVRLADACVLAQWTLSRGDTADVRRVVALLRGAAAPSDPPPLSATPAACAELLAAWLAVVERRPDAAAAVARLDSLALTPAAAGDASAYAPLVVARLHAALGTPARALAAVRERPYLTGWPRYLATMLREEGRLAAAAGDAAGAARAYRRFLVLRAGAEGGPAAQADSVRRALGGSR